MKSSRKPVYLPTILAAIVVITMLLSSFSAGAAADVGVDLYTLQTPAGLPIFAALDAFGGQVGGRAAPSADNFHAILWSGPSGAALDLTPSGYVTASVRGLVSGQQVGSVTPQVTVGTPGANAVLWSGTAASLVNLNPGLFTISTAIATDGSHQVGSVTLSVPGPGNFPHATLWSGTAASAIDLHPAGYSTSVANAVRGDQQAGQAAITNNNHAMLWARTAASAVDLNPAGATSSFALGVGDGQQVGVANFPGFSSHAALWSGTPASIVDLSPPGSAVSVLSEALDVRGGVQVGFVQLGSFDHAYRWTGSAASGIDLALLLPASLQSSSRALSIDAAGNIFGLANDNSGNVHAVEWLAVPEPSAFALLSFGALLIPAGRRLLSAFAMRRRAKHWTWATLVRKNFRRVGLMSITCLLANLSCVQIGEAATVDNWITSTGGNWNGTSNWSTGSIPTIAEDANIGSIATSATSPAIITLDANQTAYGLTLDAGAGKSIHLDSGHENKTLSLVSTDTNADGVNKFFTINAKSGTGNQINAPIVLTAPIKGSFTAMINSFDPAFAINGGISESVASWGVRITGKGSPVSYATTPSSYSGDTTIDGNGILRIDVNNAIPNGANKGNVVLEGFGQLQFLNATSQTINALNSTSSTAVVTNLAGNNGVTLTIAEPGGTFAGSINNPGGAGVFNFAKIGGGIQRLNGADTYRGTTTATGGTLLVNGTHTGAGNYSTGSGGTLGGTGTISLAGTNSVTVSTGSLAPGDNAPGVLNINGTLNMSSIGTLRVELGGAFPGNGLSFYDQVNMTSPTAAINASFAHVGVTLVNGYKPLPTDVFYILTRVDSAAFTATQPFDAYPEGASITIGSGFTGKVTYKANWKGSQAASTLTGGNDMAIFNVVPEPTSALLLALGTLSLFGCDSPRRVRTTNRPIPAQFVDGRRQLAAS